MEMKKIKLGLLRNKNSENTPSTTSNKSKKILKYLSNRNLNSSKINNSTIYSNTNISKISNGLLIYPPKMHNYHFSPTKYVNFNSDIIPNLDLKEDLLKTKELYNEQNKEILKLKIKYNKLYSIHEDTLKILNSILSKVGINTNLNNLTKKEFENIKNNCDFSNISSKEKQNIKERHLISIFKAKMLEYQYLLEKKNEEISKIKNSSKISKVSKIINDNASKSLENINLTKEKQKLSEKIMYMENAVGSLSDRCIKLKKSENKNMNNIGELQNKIRSLIDEINLKDKIIEKMKIRNKEEKRILENKIKNLELENLELKREKKMSKKKTNTK